MRLASVTQGLRPKGVVNIMARVIIEGTTVSGSANSLASAETTATCSCIAEHVQLVVLCLASRTKYSRYFSP